MRIFTCRTRINLHLSPFSYCTVYVDVEDVDLCMCVCSDRLNIMMRIKTTLDINTGREGMRSVISSNQDVIDILPDFALSPPTPPGSCHSRTQALKQLHVIILLADMHIHHFLFQKNSYKVNKTSTAQ